MPRTAPAVGNFGFRTSTADGASHGMVPDEATKAIERAREEGLNVVKAVILVDRQEGGLENIRAHVADVTAIITRDALLAHAETKQA